MKTSDFKNLRVWQEAMDLVPFTYALVNKFPRVENYALSDQLRRCVVSIPSNIAEGQGRDSKKEFKNFISIARGSLCELETQFLIAERLGYIGADDMAEVNERVKSIGRM